MDQCNVLGGRSEDVELDAQHIWGGSDRGK